MSHTGREARIVQLARDGLADIRANEKNLNFCIGSAWASLNLILEALGESPELAPWRSEARPDETQVGGGS